MEGNDCYKFSTIRNWVARTGAPPVRVVVDVGANVGAVSRLAKQYFPDARVYAFEAVAELAELARANLADLPDVRVDGRAVTAEHLYADDLGTRKRRRPARLAVMRGTPESGPGWAGGSTVLPADHPLVAGAAEVRGYARSGQPVRALTLDELVAEVLRDAGADEVDVLKMDCEGCECSSIGCASEDTLRRVRFIVGEYHGIERFHAVMRAKLFRTHKVSLIGDGALGAFLAERLDGEADGVLRFDKRGMLVPRLWLCATPVDWHLFNEAFVLPEERAIHALPPA